MSPFQFGSFIGREKSAIVDIMGAGGLYGAYNAPKGHKLEGFARGAVNAPANVAGGVIGGVGGAIRGAVSAPRRMLGSVAQGIGSGVRAGTQMTDSVMGGKANGIGGKLLRLPGQIAGGAAGAIGGTIAAPFEAGVRGVADVVEGVGGGARAGTQMMQTMTGAPTWQRSQPAKAANALTAVKPLVGELVRQAPIATKVVPRQAVQAGSNAMKYLGAGAAGLAAGVAGSKMLGGKGEQQAPKAASFAPAPRPYSPKFNLPPHMQQQQRQKLEQGVGKMFGQTAQKVVGGLNTAADVMQRSMPTTVQNWMTADSNNGGAI